MNVKNKNILSLAISGLLIAAVVPNYANAAAAQWVPLTIGSIDRILVYNGTWNGESYYGKPCGKSINASPTHIEYEWNCPRPNKGSFESHLTVEKLNYHCHVHVKGSDIPNASYEDEWQFDIPSTYTDAQKTQLYQTCGAIYDAPACVDHELEEYPTAPYMSALVTPLTPDTSKIKVCHRTASAKNPYVIITISQSAVKDRGHKTRHSTCSGKKHPDYFWSPVTKCPGETMIPPIPTVTTSPALKFQDTAAPVLTGTIGTTTLQKSGSETETFSVTVNGTTYLQGTGIGKVVISGKNWSLTLPSAITFYPDSDATPFSKLYEVTATRNPGYDGDADFVEMDDVTEMELEIYHACPDGTSPSSGVCPAITIAPSVDLKTASVMDTTIVITGKVDARSTIVPLAATGETFSVSVANNPGKTYVLGTDSQLTLDSTRKVWMLTLTGTAAIMAAKQNPGYDVTAIRNSTSDGTSGELTVTSTVVTNTPTVDTVLSDNSFDIAASRSTISRPWTQIAIEDTTPTIQGTVGEQVLNNDAFAVTISKSGYTKTYTKGVDAALTAVNGSTNWSLAIPTGNTTTLAAGVYEVNAVRTASGTATPDVTHNELVIGLPYCNNGVNDYILRTDFDGTKDASTYYLGACGTPAPKPSPLPYPDTLQPEKHPSTGACTDAEGGGDRNTLSISTATIKRATIINATTLGGTTTKNLSNTVINYGERSGGTMDISNAVITNAVAKNVTLTGVALNNLYLDIAGSFDISTGVFSPSDTYIGVIDGTVGVTKPSGDGVAIPKAQIIDGVVTSGTAADAPIRGRILAGFYDVNTSPTTLTMTKGRRITGTLTNATITGATTTTAKMPDDSIKTVVTGGTITNGALAIVSTFGTATNAKVVNATITGVNSCFTSGTVGSRGQLNWKEVIKE